MPDNNTANEPVDEKVLSEAFKSVLYKVADGSMKRGCYAISSAIHEKLSDKKIPLKKRVEEALVICEVIMKESEKQEETNHA